MLLLKNFKKKLTLQNKLKNKQFFFKQEMLAKKNKEFRLSRHESVSVFSAAPSKAPFTILSEATFKPLSKPFKAPFKASPKLLWSLFEALFEASFKALFQRPSFKAPCKALLKGGFDTNLQALDGYIWSLKSLTFGTTGGGSEGLHALPVIL